MVIFLLVFCTKWEIILKNNECSDDPFQEGWESYLYYPSERYNPYKEDSEEYEFFEDGYFAAMDQNDDGEGYAIASIEGQY
jgi:hypothetical protein